MVHHEPKATEPIAAAHTVAPPSSIGAIDGKAGNNVLTGNGAFAVTVAYNINKRAEAAAHSQILEHLSLTGSEGGDGGRGLSRGSCVPHHQ